MIDVKMIRPIGQWVLLRVLSKPGEITELPSGILVPALDKRGYCQAEVVAAGEGKVDLKTGRVVPPGVRPGDVVYIRWYLSEINRAAPFDSDHCFVHQDDLFGVFEEPEAESAIAG